MRFLLALIFVLIFNVTGFFNRKPIGRITSHRIYSIDNINKFQDKILDSPSDKIPDLANNPISNLANDPISDIANSKISDLHHTPFFPFNLDPNNIVDHYNTWLNDHTKTLGQHIVVKISSMLPNFDSVGHKVLHANNQLIMKILENPHLTDSLKKSLILTSIKLAQCGDNMGSFILELYYKIVDACL